MERRSGRAAKEDVRGGSGAADAEWVAKGQAGMSGVPSGIFQPPAPDGSPLAVPGAPGVFSTRVGEGVPVFWGRPPAEWDMAGGGDTDSDGDTPSTAAGAATAGANCLAPVAVALVRRRSAAWAAPPVGDGIMASRHRRKNCLLTADLVYAPCSPLSPGSFHLGPLP